MARLASDRAVALAKIRLGLKDTDPIVRCRAPGGVLIRGKDAVATTSPRPILSGGTCPTTIYKLRHLVPDERVAGTMLVGHAPPVAVQAFALISVVSVDRKQDEKETLGSSPGYT